MAGSTPLPREVFRSHSDRLKQAITAPVPLAGKLLAKNLMGAAVNSKVINAEAPTATKAVWILDDVRAALEASSQPGTVLKTLCDVLDDSGEPALGSIAASMRSSLDGKILNDIEYIYFNNVTHMHAVLVALEVSSVLYVS